MFLALNKGLFDHSDHLNSGSLIEDGDFLGVICSSGSAGLSPD